MINTSAELLNRAVALIQGNPESRLDWAHAGLEDRNLMLMVAAYKIGYENGYDSGNTNAKDGID